MNNLKKRIRDIVDGLRDLSNIDELKTKLQSLLDDLDHEDHEEHKDEQKIDFSHLEKYGYQVIDMPVLSKQECKARISEIWDWLESLGRGIDRDDPDSYNDSDTWPANVHGIVEFPNAAHTIAAWKTRCTPKVIDVFQKLWKTKDLLVSFDRICIQKPSSKKKNQKGWLHIDQGPCLRGRQCVQGFVTLKDMPEHGGTLVVMPKSHLYHDAFFEAFPNRLKKKDKKSNNYDHWVKFSDEELKWWDDKGLTLKRVSAKRGQLVLWDSRTAHFGAHALPGYEHLWRYVVYVCYIPRPKNTSDKCEKAIQKKRDAFLKGRATSHWPGPKLVHTERGDIWQAPKMFGKKPRFMNGQKEEPESSLKIRTKKELKRLSPLALKLAGF